MRWGVLLLRFVPVALIFTAGPVCAATGDIVSLEPLVPTLTYDMWFERAFSASDDPHDPAPDLEKARAYYTPALYSALVNRKVVAADRITYESDGLKIAGVIVRPVGRSGRLPVILWCRGGLGEIGGITTGDVLVMSNWARAGYVVIASNYRGGPRSEGHDEDGGADVDDVTALGPLARSLPYADVSRLFLYGQSRGGMMVYRAIANGLSVRAAAVNSGVSDLARTDRPDAAEMDALMREAMPDYTAEKANRFCRRSAICWTERLRRTPLLLLHGTADWRVPAVEALDLARQLQAIGAPYTLHLFDGGSHVWLDQDQAARDREILDFFQRHDALGPMVGKTP